MARQVHTVQTPLGAYGDYTPANIANVVFLASDIANAEEVAFTGRELILARNVGGVNQVAIVESAPDPFNRSGDQTFIVTPGTTAMMGPFLRPGFIQAGGLLHFNGSGSDLEWAVITLPGSLFTA